MALATFPVAELPLQAEVLGGRAGRSDGWRSVWQRLGPGWEALERASAAPPWLSHAWLSNWWECYGGAQELRVVGLAMPAGPAAAPAWAALLPLALENYKGCRRLRGCGFDSQRRGPLCHAHALPEVLPALAGALARRRDWDCLQLDSLPTAVAAGLAARFRELGLVAAVTPQGQQRYVRLSDPWAEVVSHWHHSFWRDVQRAERRLSELGPVSFEVITDARAAAAVFPDCMRVEASGWKGRQNTAILSAADSTRFFTDLLGILARQGRLNLMLLRCHGALVAFGLTVRAHGVISGLKIGMDEGLRRCSPGMVLYYRQLQYAHQAGCREVDFLGADDAFKARWSPHVRPLSSLCVYNRTLRGRLLTVRRSSPVACARRLLTFRPAVPA